MIRSHSYARNEVFIWINRTPSGMRFSARFPRESHVGEVVGPTLIADPEARTAPGVIAREEGPVHAYLHDFAEFVRSVGDASTFGSTV